jgi:DNA-binding NtrC family response regulator
MHISCIYAGALSAEIRKKIAASLGPKASVAESSLADWMKWLPLTKLSADSPVLLIGEKEMSSAQWPFVRVRLAEAGRFFIVVLAPPAGTAACVAAMREGAYEMICPDESVARWRAAIETTRQAEALWVRLFGPPLAASADGLIGRSAALMKIREMAARVGPTRASVLLLGESGTGKERVAQALHHHYRGGTGPFLAINCAALPRDLLEAELFGTTKGAYTGAVADRPGLVEQAAGGTLFLDEIGDMDRALQPKLLRFLETRRARRLGARADYAVDVRIVSATNSNLRAKIATGQFREDLYYRLAEITLELPPLRDRPEDIPLLCRQFLAEAADRHDKVVTSMEPALLQKLQTWPWPGNIRELRSTVDRLVIMATDTVLRAGSWSPPVDVAPIARPAENIMAAAGPAPAPAASAGEHTAQRLSKRGRKERAFKLLAESHGDQSWVASQLAIHPTTLYRWRKQAGLK